MKICLTLLFAIVTARPLPAGAWYTEVDFGLVEAALRSQPISGMENLEDALTREKGRSVGCNPDYMTVVLADGTRGVFRSEEEPWGSQAEVAGYRMSRYLGMALVPPTVPRTISRDALGARAPWPWGEPTRAGSLQLYVSCPVHVPAASTDPKQESDVQILSFIMGRYDNHEDNILRDATGAAILIDFENGLESQRVAYGDYPFVRRGGRYHPHHVTSVPSSAPFPFEHPQVLIDPTVEEIHRVLGPWWNSCWPQGMTLLHRLLNSIPGRRVPFVVWDDRLWVQVRTSARKPACTRIYSRRTLARLEALTPMVLQTEILVMPPYRPEIIDEIMDRTRQVLEAARTGEVID